MSVYSRASRRRMRKQPSAECTALAPGAYLVNGKLFFRLLDGSSINCECIAGPYAQAVVDLFNEGR